MGLLADFLEGVDNVIRRSSPFIAAGVFVGSFYWTAVTYGAITIMQVIGHEEGLRVLEDTDHVFLMVALPAIPICLVLGRMIRWEDAILRYLQHRQRKNFRLLGLILPVPEDNENNDNNYAENNQMARNISDTLSTTRVLCGALILPSISSVVGRLIFSNVKNNLHRTLLGGLAFIAVKGMLKIYFKQKQFIRKRQRKIVDYTEDNIQRYLHNRLPFEH
jgi:E3 ubiquitin-protein ligase MARCH5